MGAFVDRGEVKVIRDKGWADHEEVTIQKLDTTDHDAIRAEVVELTVDLEAALGDDEDAPLRPLTKRQHKMARVPVILRGIKEWTFTANGGKPSETNPPLAINRQTVGALKRRYSEYIYDQVNEFNQDWTEEERAAFFRAMRQGVQGGRAVSD